MKDLFPVKVECYAGYKADEYPRSFHFENNRFDVAEIIDRWYQSSSPGEQDEPAPVFPSANYYKVRTTDGKIYILKHETQTGNWYLWIKGESIFLY